MRFQRAGAAGVSTVLRAMRADSEWSVPGVTASRPRTNGMEWCSAVPPRRPAPAAWVAALVAIGAAACSSTGTEEPPLRQAEAATRAEDWSLAAELWHEVHLAAGGRDARACYETARALYRSGDPPSACALLRRGLEVTPDDLDLLELSGEIQRECGFRRAAELSYERLVQRDPARAAAWRALAELRVELGLERAAMDPLRHAIALCGDDAELYVLLGDVERVTSRPLLAWQAYGRAAELGELELETLVHAGELSLVAEVRDARPDALDRGQVWLERAVELDPQSTRGHFLLGRVAEEQGRAEDATASYRRAVETDPGCLEALTNLAVLYARLGDEVGTADIVARALAIESDPSRRAALMELLGSAPRDDPPR